MGQNEKSRKQRKSKINSKLGFFLLWWLNVMTNCEKIERNIMDFNAANVYVLIPLKIFCLNRDIKYSTSFFFSAFQANRNWLHRRLNKRCLAILFHTSITRTLFFYIYNGSTGHISVWKTEILPSSKVKGNSSWFQEFFPKNVPSQTFLTFIELQILLFIAISKFEMDDNIGFRVFFWMKVFAQLFKVILEIKYSLNYYTLI